jgi:UDP-N-acetylglucosamine diphosphorylase/glucosamine-1-phosphate N-acetyltransferase
MQITLVDFNAKAFYPFTETRPISELQMVGGTIAELWKALLPQASISYICSEALTGVFSEQHIGDNIYVDSRLVPNKKLTEILQSIPVDASLVDDAGQILAFRTSENISSTLKSNGNWSGVQASTTVEIKCDTFVFIESANDLFLKLGEHFELFDFDGFPHCDCAAPGVIIIGDDLFAHPDAKIAPGYYDTTSGPIILGKDAEVSAGAMLKGPMFIGEHAIVKMGAKIYGPTVIGKECRVGGEVSNCNVGAFSNKGHDGFIGNAVIGEWCNLGADTNCSNLKNNYSKVKQYNHVTKHIESTEMLFCGVLMGDHSKTAINTQINTATVFGAFSNAVCSSFPPKHLPNFSWFTDQGLFKFELAKAYEMAEAMMARRNVSLTDETKSLWRFLAQ